MNLNEPRRDDLAAYSIGALSEPESAELEAHLAGCAECREYLEWLRPAVDALPASVEQLKPPRGLRRDLLATIREEERAVQGSTAGVARHRRWSPRSLIRRPVIVVAACALLVCGVAAGWLLHGSGSEGELIAAVPTESAPANTVAAVVERDGSEGTLHVESLPELPAGTTYQAWVQHGEVMVPSTTFDGAAGEEVPLEGTLDGASGVYVTVEPDGGSPEPTSAPLLAAPLA